VALAACKQSAPAVAVLSSATGATDRQAAGKDWARATAGASYFIDDGARVGGGTATLEVGGGAAHILMLDGTTLRFRGTPARAQIVVETGAIDLAGSGSFALDVGDVTLPKNGTIRITAKGGGRLSLALTIGDGKGALAANGRTFDLAIGAPIDVGGDASVPVDAGTPDAPPPRDAQGEDAPAESSAVTLEITGTGARQLLPGQTAWQPLPPGPGTLPRGGALRLDPRTRARAVSGPTTLELDRGAQLRVGDDGGLTVEAGPATVAATAEVAIALPGGTIALGGSESAPAQTRIDVGAREARVAMLRGGGTLTGAPGSERALRRGETGVLARSGALRVEQAIPDYFDFRVVAGETLTIHDPRPPTAVQWQFDGKCPDGGTIEIDRDGRFRTPAISEGKDFANVMIVPGAWHYRLRCTSHGVEGPAVASGQIACLRDEGRRPLPRAQGVNDIDDDGRTYRISYQSAIPTIAVHVRDPGAVHRLHLASSGTEQLFASDMPTIIIPGNRLREGTYTYWVERDGQKRERPSTLIIDFDQTAPQVYIESPGTAEPWKSEIDVRGAVLPGWSAAIENIAVPIDPQRRFSAKVGTPSGRALAIRLSHPQRGVHYYLRRPKPSP